MLPALLPHGQLLLMTAASRTELETTLAELVATREARDRGGEGSEPGTDLQSRIVVVEQALAQAQVVPGGEPTQAVVGTVVDVHDGRKQSRYTLTVLAPPEDPPGSIAVSVTSPVGVALIGSAVGDTAVVALPDGRRRELQVTRIQPTP
ncbi:MAG: GreA/GreB family elongation factor [Patulibacter sp.]|nr:GreA/GreB family elongation factor [Patulibacter sp.]